MAYRVDNFPLILRPFYYSLSYFFALILFSCCYIIRLTCRINYSGKERLKVNNYIYCTWHQSLAAYFIVFTKQKTNHIWLNHPAWNMKPVHYWIKLTGVKKLALGSSGNSGKEALQEVILYLKQGYNTLITPDGPAGPVRKLKPGVLQMSLETGIPIVTVKIIPSHFITLATWDKKRIPLPCSTIKVIYGKPLIVTEKNFTEAVNILEEQLKE